MNKNLNALVKRWRDQPWGRNLSEYDDGQEKMLDQCADELEAVIAADIDDLTPENIAAIEEGTQQSRDGKVVEMDFSAYVQQVTDEMADKALAAFDEATGWDIREYAEGTRKRNFDAMRAAIESALGKQP
jgi:hypothetical protein